MADYCEIEENLYNLYSIIQRIIMEEKNSNLKCTQKKCILKVPNEKGKLIFNKTRSESSSRVCFENDQSNTQINTKLLSKENNNINRKKTFITAQICTKITEKYIQDRKGQKNDLVSETHVDICQKIKILNKFYSLTLSHEQNKLFIYKIIEGVQYCHKNMDSLITYKHVNKNAKMLNGDENSNKKFLFLDLDETLIKTQNKEGCESNTYKISIRPYTAYFLEYLSRFYDIYVFTAATRRYAQAAISKLNRKDHKAKIFIQDYLCRTQCIQTRKRGFIKDLRIVKNRDLKDIVIIDNLVESFGLQLNNGIPIPDFIGQEKDEELFKLIPFLQKLSQVDDVRPVIKKKFNIQSLAKLKRDEIDKYLKTKSS